MQLKFTLANQNLWFKLSHFLLFTNFNYYYYLLLLNNLILLLITLLIIIAYSSKLPQAILAIDYLIESKLLQFLMHTKILFVGHSYLKTFKSGLGRNYSIGNTNFEFDFFYKPGGKIDFFVNNLDLEYRVNSFEPNVIFIYLGGNDIDVLDNLGKVKANFIRLINYLKEKFPHIKIVASEVELRFFRTRESLHLIYNQQVKNLNRWLSNKKIVHRLFRFKYYNLTELDFQTDGVHLNEIGFNKLMQAIYQFLEFNKDFFEN